MQQQGAYCITNRFAWKGLQKTSVLPHYSLCTSRWPWAWGRNQNSANPPELQHCIVSRSPACCSALIAISACLLSHPYSVADWQNLGLGWARGHPNENQVDCVALSVSAQAISDKIILQGRGRDRTGFKDTNICAWFSPCSVKKGILNCKFNCTHCVQLENQAKIMILW